MIHPLLRLLATQPQLLAEHVEAYAQMVGDEVGKTSTMWLRRMVLFVVAAAMAGIGVVMVGVALMLFGVQATSSMPYPWLLIVVPAAFLVAAAICVWIARSQPLHNGLNRVKQQLQADMAMLHEVNAS
jgi:hypothetical protein